MLVLFFQRFLRIFIIGILSFILYSCADEERNPVPVIPVEFTINTEFQYIELNSPGGWVNVFGGFGGIVIYRFSVDEFRAFDRACPYHPYDEAARVIVEDPPLAECPVCGSTFLLLDGSVVTGPSKHPLRSYRAQFNNPFLYVYSY